MKLEPGSTVAGYRIERMLGQGGMGSVYLAQHPRLPRKEALKLLAVAHVDDADFRARFEREGNLAGGLTHPNIVAVNDRGIDGDQPWISMQYVPGTDCDTALSSGPMPPARAVAIISDAAKGLDYAHRNGLLHRDIKPANILLTASPDNGSTEIALVADFGIARLLDDTQHFTQTGSVLGSAAYAAPEQLAGKPIDHRADIYALGCTLFQLLTARKPYPHSSMVAVITAHLYEPPPKPSEAVSSLPPAFDAVIAKAMAKAPEDRFGSCRELAEAAASALSTPLSSPEPGRPNSDPTVITGPPAIAPPQPPASPPSVHRAAPVRSARSWKPLVAGVAALVVTLLVISAFLVSREFTRSASSSGETTSTSTGDFSETSIRLTGHRNNISYEIDVPQVQGGDFAVGAAFNQWVQDAVLTRIEGSQGNAFSVTTDHNRLLIEPGYLAAVSVTNWLNPANPAPLVTHVMVSIDRNGRHITLDRLFVSEISGLDRLSQLTPEIVKAQVGDAFNPEGVAPEAYNYRQWLPTPDGLEIVFPQYVVAPESFGDVAVTVPWADLRDVMDPEMYAAVTK